MRVQISRGIESCHWRRVWRRRRDSDPISAFLFCSLQTRRCQDCHGCRLSWSLAPGCTRKAWSTSVSVIAKQRSATPMRRTLHTPDFTEIELPHSLESRSMPGHRWRPQLRARDRIQRLPHHLQGQAARTNAVSGQRRQSSRWPEISGISTGPPLCRQPCKLGHRSTLPYGYLAT
jgi:hypothetical protein